MKPRSRPVLRFLTRLALVVCVLFALGIVSFGVFVLQDSPSLEASAPPTPEDVRAARQFIRDVRAVSGTDAQAGDRLLATVPQINSVIRLGTRFIEGFRGQAAIAADEVIGEASLPLNWFGTRKWLNLSGHVPAFDGTLKLRRVTVGAYDIPPAIALFVGRVGANLVLGNQFGDRVIQSASAMEITPEGLRFDIALDRVGQNGVMRDVFGTIRGQSMPGSDEIETYHRLIRAAMADETLPAAGSFVPYLHFALSAALERSTPETLANEYTAAVFGLAKACGALDLAMIVGRIAFDRPDTPVVWDTDCNDVTFNGRIDSRRHFITSAALQAASNTGVAISIGEFKELYDSISGAGGFDFTDMAANLSGIRLSNVLMSTASADWPARLARLEAEGDVIVPFDGIPQIMTEEVFKERFQDVNSEAYKAMLAQIEARIDRLDLYQPLP